MAATISHCYASIGDLMFYAHSTNDESKADWQALDDHLLTVGALASEKAARFAAEDAARVAGVLHDLGKYSRAFQKRLEGEAARVDHSTMGARVARDQFKPMGQLLAYAIAGHHAGLANGRDPGERTPLRDRLLAELPAVGESWRAELPLPEQLPAPKNFTLRRDRACFQYAFLTRMLFSCLVDADFIDTEAFYTRHETGKSVTRGGRPQLQPLREALDQHLATLPADNDVNRLRNEILTHVRGEAATPPGRFTLTVPTGGGKTLASLAFAFDHAIAHGMDRIIYVIPFTSIVEQNAAVFRNALGAYGDDAVLEHHSAFDAGDDTGNRKRDRASIDKLRRDSENWDAPIIVTTAVQFYESLFAAKTSRCRKLHNLARSVVILDEAQTLPLKLLRPAVAALDELTLNYNSSVVLCTATQPALAETDNPQRSFQGGLRDLHELAPEPERLYRELERVSVSYLGTISDEGLREHLLAGEQVLCIVNNRRHARALFESIADQPGACHLTTALCAAHRRKALTEVRRRLDNDEPCRLIATSLIEAGVDVDFPRVLRAEAGLDSIAQAAGRCNREGKRSAAESEVLVFATANEDWAPPPELKQYAQVAHGVLRQYPDTPLTPDAIEAYFRMLYWQQGDQALDKHDLLGQFARSSIDSLPFENVAKKFRMIENTQQAIIIPYNDQARHAIRALEHADTIGGFARKLQPYMVQIPYKGFTALYRVGAIAPINPDKLGDQFMLLVNEDLYDCGNLGLNWVEPAFRSSESNIW